MSSREILNTIFDKWEDGREFHGWELKEAFTEFKPERKNCYEDTVMREARHYCRDRFICISKPKSLYRKIC